MSPSCAEDFPCDWRWAGELTLISNCSSSGDIGETPKQLHVCSPVINSTKIVAFECSRDVGVGNDSMMQAW